MIFSLRQTSLPIQMLFFMNVRMKRHIKSRGRFRHIIVPSVLKINKGKEL